MSRREFINLLTDSLAGRVPGRLISEKADYYRGYITNRAQEMGISEEEVIEELGPPELIAHTIIDVYEAEYGVYEGGPEASYREEARDGMRSDGGEESEGGRFFHIDTTGRGCFLLSFFIVFAFLAVGIWMLRIIAAYPLIVLGAVLILYLWIQYKKKR